MVRIMTLHPPFHLMAFAVPMHPLHFPIPAFPVKFTLHALQLKIQRPNFKFMFLFHALDLHFQLAGLHFQFEFDDAIVGFVHFLMVMVLFLNRLPFGPTFLLGQFAVSNRFLDSLAYHFQFILMSIGSGGNRMHEKQNYAKKGGNFHSGWGN